MTRGIIAAVSPEGVIGLNGDLPWHYSADLKRFKRVTLGSTVIMGRLTWESLPRKPLVGRRNIVICGSDIEGVECFRDIESALATCAHDVWFIGGARLFEEAMHHADVIDMTFVPDRIDDPNAVRFPVIDSEMWEAGPMERDPNDERLTHRVYRRRTKEIEK